MKKLFLPLLLCLCSIVRAGEIKGIDIFVTLTPDGSAQIVERWDIIADEGTEWYLNKSNLGDIRILDYAVIDETGCEYINEGDWNVDRSLKAKAGRCGIVRKRDGVELCWGFGSYGPHCFTIRYTMTGAVKSLVDYDMLHIQFVSPGLSSRPERVRLTMDSGLCRFGTENSRIWGFGFEGNAEFADGQIVLSSTERFRSNSSLILLARFDKGIFVPTSVQNRAFDEVLAHALEGSSYQNSEDSEMTDRELISFVISFILGMALLVLLVSKLYRNYVSSIIGVPVVKDVQWSRDVPFGGNILESNYVLTKVVSRDYSGVASAMILRMVQRGDLVVSKDGRSKVELHFADEAHLSNMGGSERRLFEMMKEASGRDEILQDREFSRWSNRHQRSVQKWIEGLDKEAKRELVADGSISAGGRFTPEGKSRARGVLGFRKFLKDFTLIDERGSAEVGLWNDYLVFGALFGIAEKVMKELKDIDPKMLEETVYMDYWTMYHLMSMSRSLSRAIVNATVSRSASAGFGGTTSFGGGGGFSGGGFGGGAR